MFSRKIPFLFVMSASGLFAADIYAVSGADSTNRTINLIVGQSATIDIWVKNQTDTVNAAGVYLDLTGETYYNLQAVTPVTTIFSDSFQLTNSETYVDYSVLTGGSYTQAAEFKLLTLTFQAFMSGSAYIAFTDNDTGNRITSLYNVSVTPANVLSNFYGCTILVSSPADTIPPPDITGIIATAGNASATVAWVATPSSVTDSYYYSIFYSTAPITFVEAPGVFEAGQILAVLGDTDFVCTGLTNGQQYYFAVTCNDSYFNEDTYPSNTATCTPTAPTPPVGGLISPQYIYSAYHTINIDGTNDFTVDTEEIASCTTVTDWGASNDLDTLYLTYSADTIYIGVRGTLLLYILTVIMEIQPA